MDPLVRRQRMTTPTQTHALTATRILVVDDEDGIRDCVSRALAAAGYLTEDASSGGDGLRLALTGGYGLVILDLVMPDMDGRDFLTRLLRVHPDQPVLVLSCIAEVNTKVDCLELGAQDYLTKPFSLAELRARVRVRLRGEPHALGELIKTGSLVLDVGRLS